LTYAVKGIAVVKKDAIGGFDVVISSSRKENRYAGKTEALRTNEDPNRRAQLQRVPCKMSRRCGNMQVSCDQSTVTLGER